MEERKKNLCAMIPESLHKKVREEQEEWGIKLNEYMERLLKDHFEKGEREMESGMRTLAFQVSEELFQTVNLSNCNSSFNNEVPIPNPLYF